MQNPDQPTEGPRASTPADRALLEGLVAACIEAIENGAIDPAPEVCAARPDLLPRVQKQLAQLALRGLIPPTEAPAPARIGAYHIERELGSGGMGTVYLAEQREPVRRKVAVKVVKLGMDTREVVLRFQAERQTLASLSHPHIAQVHDAGATADGRPYFVMEYVEGRPITSFCEEHGLDAEARMRLFATVCRAVQHAHDRGVIHRDLKPSNILVALHEGLPVPKVIDFGVAKAAGPGAGIESLHTRADQVLGTPEYMSPEQACTGGLDIDVRTDVYSLGVVLYELLCGQLPFDSRRLRSATRSELERILLEELPTSPSTRLSAAGGMRAGRSLETRSTATRGSARELDWIALKALAKLRHERYPSALALAEDVERWLAHEPVHAAPPGAFYRARKFVRRHRVAVGAGVVVLLALTIGLIVSLLATSAARTALRKEEQALHDMRAFFDLARDAVANLVDVADDRLLDVPRAEPVRRAMLEDALRFYTALQQAQPRDRSLRIDIAHASDRVGVLQHRLGHTAEAVATLRDCVAAAATLRAEAPLEPRVLRLCIAANGHLAEACSALGAADDAKAGWQAALAEVAALRAIDPGPPGQLDANEAALLASLAIEFDTETDTALAHLERAVAAFSAARAHQPDDQLLALQFARCLGRRSELMTRQNRIEEAATGLQQALALLAPAGAEDSVVVHEARARLLTQAATVWRRLRRLPEARQAQQAAVELWGRLAAAHPDVPGHADRQAAGLHFLGELANAEDRWQDAVQHLRDAVDVRERLAARAPDDPRVQLMLVRSLQTLVSVLTDAWQHHDSAADEVLQAQRRVIALVDRLAAAHADDDDVVIAYAAVHEGHAAVLDGLRRHDEAMAEHQLAQRALDRLVARAPQLVAARAQVVAVYNNLVLAHWRANDAEAAVAAGEQGVRHLRAGLALDARNAELLGMAPQLFGRIAAAHQAAGDAAAMVAAQCQLLELPELDDNAREIGAMLLAGSANHVDDPATREALLTRAERELRACLQRRAAAGAALASDGGRQGTSLTTTQQRDLDLYLHLGSVLGRRGDRAAQREVADAALALAAAMPRLSPERLRSLHAQTVEWALALGDVELAAQRAEALLARSPDDGVSVYFAAVLLARTSVAAGSAADRERLAASAVDCLRRGLAGGIVPPTVLRNEDLAPLQRRADFQQLLPK